MITILITGRVRENHVLCYSAHIHPVKHEALTVPLPNVNLSSSSVFRPKLLTTKLFNWNFHPLEAVSR